MKTKHPFTFLAFSAFAAIAVLSLQSFEDPFLSDNPPESDDIHEPTFHCRCHTSDNQCYGGNAISFRELCYSGPVEELVVVNCHVFDSVCGSESTETDKEP